MIELKKGQFSEIYGILDKIQLNKILNADVRKTILKVILSISKSIKTAEEDIDNMKKRYFAEFKPEDLQDLQNILNEINWLIRSNKIEEAKAKDLEATNKYPEICKAITSLNADLVEMNEESVQYNIEKISLDSFIDSIVGQPIEISAKELDILKPILNDEFES